MRLRASRDCGSSSSRAMAVTFKPAPTSNGSMRCAPRRPRRISASRGRPRRRFGGGTGLIAACDIVIAADNAVFSISEARWGLTAAIIIPQLNDAIGVRQVRRYALTGERFAADEARRIGLVHEIVPPAELESAGARIVGHLLENGPDAISQTKAIAMRSAWSHLDEAAFEQLIESHAAKRQSTEAAEGLASYAQKRPARWGKTRS